MSNNIDPAESHGHSPAAWAAVIIMLVAFTAGTVFFYLDMPVLVWISAAVFALGGLVGWLMSKAGYGVNGPKFVPANH